MKKLISWLLVAVMAIGMCSWASAETADALDFEDGLFDVVVSRNVTWNLPEPERGYAEWARVLRPGGLIINFDANWYRYLIDDSAPAVLLHDDMFAELAAAAAARTSSSVAPCLPRRMFSMTVSSKSTTSWNTME